MSPLAPVGSYELLEEPALCTPWMTVRMARWRRPDGEDLWYYQEHPGCALVLPVTASGTLHLTRIWRPAIQGWCVEAPAGRIEPGEEPVRGALREMAEEIGGTCADILELGQFYASTGSSDERVHLFLAIGVTLTARRDPDPGEVIEPWAMPAQDALAEIIAGRIADAPTALAITLADRRGLLVPAGAEA